MAATTGTENISVWLIEDHEDYRRMVAWQINQMPGYQCARQFSNCETALAVLGGAERPKVILCDIGLPGMDGIAGIRKIKKASPETHVVVLTVYDDHDKVFNAICAGASGYLLKSASEEGIVSAVQETLNGGAPINPRIARLVLESFVHQRGESGDDDYALTNREREVLELIVKGLIKKEIADTLGVSFHTVNSQIRSIYKKLRVHTRQGAVAKAIKERLF